MDESPQMGGRIARRHARRRRRWQIFASVVVGVLLTGSLAAVVALARGSRDGGRPGATASSSGSSATVTSRPLSAVVPNTTPPRTEPAATAPPLTEAPATTPPTTAPATSPAVFRSELHPGSRGADVVALQQ